MIKQYIITLDAALPENAAYALYSALLAGMPPSAAQAIHDSPHSPICQYVHGNQWYLSVLAEQYTIPVSHAIQAMKEIPLHRFRKTVHIIKLTERSIDSAEDLLESALPNVVTLRLQTPTAFKSANQYQLLPTQQLIVHSLIQRWNACFYEECPIEDEGGGMEALSAGLQYRHIQLSTEDYQIKSISIPGAVGSIQIHNHLTGFHRQMADALLQFGTYSGIGIKTRLGMGGMTLDWR